MTLELKSFPAFVQKLYKIIEDLKTDVFIKWTDSGKSFLIIDPTEFSNKLLPKIFKTTNLSSFIRQLNKYDFHKVKSETKVKAKYGENVLEFSNENFIKGRPDLICKISRKRTNKENLKNNSNEFSDTEDLYNLNLINHHIINTMATITRYFQLLSNDNINLNEKVTKLIKLLEKKENKFSDKIFENSKILVAEDNAACSMHIKNILEKSNFIVSVSESIVEFTNYCKIEKFSAILISTQIPSAIAIISTLRSFDPYTPIILTSEYNEYEDLNSEYPGTNGVIYKPFKLQNVVNTIKMIITQKNFKNQNLYK